MKTYIYYYTYNGRTFSFNFKAKDLKEALEIAVKTGYRLVGEKIGEVLL